MTIEVKEILLVEDNPHDARLTMRALTESHLANKIVHLQDGEEAIDYLFCKGKYANRDLNDLPVLILLDLKMPKVDGIEVLEKIKKEQRTRTIPVTVFTSSAEDPDVKKCYTLGVNSYVVKPMDFTDFNKVVEDIGLYWMVTNHPV